MLHEALSVRLSAVDEEPANHMDDEAYGANWACADDSQPAETSRESFHPIPEQPTFNKRPTNPHHPPQLQVGLALGGGEISV
jgi:hypothetical protein